MLLSVDRYEMARTFLKQHARKLDLALFEYEFESGSVDAVLRELAPYQNDDGGFGQALEPDLRCRESSAVATVQGLQILTNLGINETNEMVIGAIQYLLSTFIPEKMRWSSVPKQVNEAPHAPWWDYRVPTTDKLGWATEEDVNASIVGFLHQYKGLVPQTFLQSITEYALACLDVALEQKKVDISYVQFAEGLEGELHDAVYAKFSPYIRQVCQTKLDEWNISRFFYLAHPVNSKYTALALEIMPISTEYIVSQQQEDGTWSVQFAWNQYPYAWEVAKVEWTGIITRGQLSLLRRFCEIRRYKDPFIDKPSYATDASAHGSSRNFIPLSSFPAGIM